MVAELLVTTAVLSSLGVLSAAGIFHALHPAQFRESVQAQEVLKSHANELVVFVILTEILVGGGGLISVLLLPASSLSFASLLAAFALYWAYACYTLYLALRRPGVPCGCSIDGDVVSVWTVGRAAFLGIAALGGALLNSRMVDIAVSRPFTIAALATLAFSVLLWELPKAMSMDGLVESSRQGR